MKSKILFLLLIGALFMTVASAESQLCTSPTVIRGIVSFSDGSSPVGTEVTAYINNELSGRSGVSQSAGGYYMILNGVPNNGSVAVNLIATKGDKTASKGTTISCGDPGKEVNIVMTASGGSGGTNNTASGNANANQNNSGSANTSSNVNINNNSQNSNPSQIPTIPEQVQESESSPDPLPNPIPGSVPKPGQEPSTTPPTQNTPTTTPTPTPVPTPTPSPTPSPTPAPSVKPKPSVSGLYVSVSPSKPTSGEDIEITVTFNNIPVPNAKVKITLPNGATINEKTNSEGVLVTKLQAGDATINVESNGASQSKKIIVEGGGGLFSYFWILILAIILILAYVVFKRTRD